MWRLINRAFHAGIIALVLLLCSCEKNIKSKKFTFHPAGYYFSLLTFNADSVCYHSGKIAQVQAIFKTQNDSVFWDSHNNLNDNLFIKIDSVSLGNFFRHHVSVSCAGDSVGLLIKTKDFFVQQFNTDSIPFFCKTDSVIKIDFKIQELFSDEAFGKICNNLQQKEQKNIESYFRSPALYETAKDPNGYYWIIKPKVSQLPDIVPGDLVTITYEARFVNGRFFEKSANNFEFIYGTPDQLLKGLNYVIGGLKLGQNAKILLPSRLAFGESGSSNGTVPPYTPLIYEIKIIDVKKIK